MIARLDEAPASVYDIGLVDLDGVCFAGSRPIPGAGAALDDARARGLRPRFVTNNASRTPAQVAAHLRTVGVVAHPNEITTSSQAIASVLAAELPAGAHVLVVGGAGLREAVSDVGLVPVDSADCPPQAVVQGYSPDVGWPALAEAAYAIEAGAAYYASNLDATLPTERGFAPGNGALVQSVVTATGVTPRSAGKPSPEIFHQAAKLAGGRSPVAVGDRLDTDIAGANAAGYPSLHVLTGVDGPAALMRAAPEQRPTYLAADLTGLLVRHPEVRPETRHSGAGPQQEETIWRCRGAWARVDDGMIAVGFDCSEDAIDLLRAAVCASWAYADAFDGPPRGIDVVADLVVAVLARGSLS